MSYTGIHGETVNFNALDQAEVWFQVINHDGRILYLNEYAEKLCGYTLNDFTDNDDFWERLFRTRETGLRVLNLFRNMIRRGKDSRSNLTRIISKSGEILHLHWTMKCIRNTDGKIASAYIIGIDHTASSSSLSQESGTREYRYRQIFRNAPIGFFRSLPEGRFLEVNNALATLLGYDTPEDVLKNISNIGSSIYFDPGFRNTVVNETLNSGGVQSFETRFVNIKGEPIDVRINVSSRFDEELDNHILEGTIENISARKEAEKSLNRNLLKYSTLFEKSPISIWEIDFSEVKLELDKLPVNSAQLRAWYKRHPEELNRIRQKIKIIDVNQATLDLFDVKSKEELIELQKIYAGSGLAGYELKSMVSLINNEFSFEFESVFQTLDRKEKNIIVRWVTAPETEKQYGRVLVSMIDITDQRAEHEALRKSKNELSTLLSSMDDLVFIFNSKGKYLYVAPTRTDMLIMSAKELEGKYIHNFLKPELVPGFIAGINRSLDEQRTVSVDYPLTLHGDEYWFEAKISPLSAKNVIVVARNITGRVNSDRVNQVMLNVARAVSTTDMLDDLFELIRLEISKIIDTKNFFLALFDESANTLELTYFRDEKDDFDHFPAEKTLSELVIKEKRSMLLKEKEVHELANEGKINVVGSVAKVWLGIPLMVEGEVLGIMVVQNYENEQAIREEHKQVLEMISPQISLSIRRKQSEQLLKKSEKQLRESNETKDRFFNIIAHDLKNPFNAIIGFTQLLTDEWDEFDDDEKISMISSIKSSSEGAFDLLMNLLEWSRLHVGKIRFEPEFVEIDTLVRLNLSLLKTAAEKKTIRLLTTGLRGKLIWADPNMIKTVIRNLLTNAIKFTPDNGTITVECHKNPDIPGMIVLSIKDNGMGIPDEELKRLFSISNQGSRTGTDGETGTGLGLVLCREFIERNRGKIWAESQTDSGSIFHIALPVRPGRL